ncbi:MAG: hypothetical protein LUH05_03335 [Candidatus Gastranaerophilales bacterium]|nr:hypothetical protein [Candidatus Gastranaerophilales bacterium]
MNSTMEKQTETMQMKDQFFGEISKENSKECAIMGLIKNQKMVLEEELSEAKLRYADVALEDENWSGKYERKMTCKILEGQIVILSKLQHDFECMMSPSMTMA